jgi:hypothetical protein
MIRRLLRRFGLAPMVDVVRCDPIVAERDRLRVQLDRLERDYATLWARDASWAENNVLQRPSPRFRKIADDLPFDKALWERTKNARLTAAAPARDDFQWAQRGYWVDAD